MCSFLSQPPPPPGMVAIPAGTNKGIDPDCGAYSLTVEAFFMDATEVTKAKWEEVYSWALTNGYSFAHAGAGKTANHPVQTVNWYDCVKWCNARSQKEGRMPCYLVGENVYMTGQREPDFSFAVNGYRLPMAVEWEYAARGGLRGKRFPWGDIIDHTKANYLCWESRFTYDKGYQGYDKRFRDYKKPYTSPAGMFAANGYGLYDMAGNVWEWCNDTSGHFRYDMAGNVWKWCNDASVLNRTVRGGCWNNDADIARCRGTFCMGAPVIAHYNYGFRTVCRYGTRNKRGSGRNPTQVIERLDEGK